MLPRGCGSYKHYMRGKLNRRNVRQFRTRITFRQSGRVFAVTAA